MDFNEQLKSFGADLVSKLQAGVDVLARETPLFVKEALAYWSMMSWFYTIISLIIFSVALVIMITYIKKAIKDEDNHTEGYVITAVGTGMISVIAFIVFCYNVTQSIQSMVAPRLFLIEHLKGLFK